MSASPGPTQARQGRTLTKLDALPRTRSTTKREKPEAARMDQAGTASTLNAIGQGDASERAYGVEHVGQARPDRPGSAVVAPDRRNNGATTHVNPCQRSHCTGICRPRPAGRRTGPGRPSLSQLEQETALKRMLRPLRGGGGPANVRC